MPKTSSKGYTYKELQQYRETVIKPLFEDQDLVQQNLLSFAGKGLVSKLNDALSIVQDDRRWDFKNSQVVESEFGMLVEDMRKRELFSVSPSPIKKGTSSVRAKRRSTDANFPFTVHDSDLFLEFKSRWVTPVSLCPRHSKTVLELRERSVS
jgi:inositol-pentakisphosphate 2-kinase